LDFVGFGFSDSWINAFWTIGFLDTGFGFSGYRDD
jgi:hypothetical protein